MIKRRRRSLPELDTTSTADISFMLLIFFLVASSMDLDKGLARRLTPADQEEVREETLVQRDKAITLTITEADSILLNGSTVGIRDLPAQLAQQLIAIGADHLIVIDAAPQATYNAYFAVQNSIAAAYRDVRDAISKSKYRLPYSRLSESQRQDVRNLCPQHIAENEQ